MEILHAFGNKMSEFRFRYDIIVWVCFYSAQLFIDPPFFLMRKRAGEKSVGFNVK